MIDEPLKNKLLEQNGHSSVDEELARLRQLLDAQQTRVRRLTRWTIGVWLAFGLMLMLPVLAVILPHVLARQPHTPAGTQPASLAVAEPAVGNPPSADTPDTHAGDDSQIPGPGILVAVLVSAVVPLFFGLLITGITLTIMLILARRTVSMGQINASLASVDARLRMLSMSQKPAPKE